MMTSNPYNLPDKIIKPNQAINPIHLQNKRSRERSQEFGKEFASKGIKLESQLKKSMNLQHVTSSPNLHTPSTSSSSNRQIEQQIMTRPLEYHHNHTIQAQETENDRKIKFLFEKFYQINDQLSNHELIMNKLITEKEISERSSRDLSFDHNIPLLKTEKDEPYLNQHKGLHSNPLSSTSLPSENVSNSREIEQVRKELNSIKEQIHEIRTNFHKEKEQENVLHARHDDRSWEELSRISFTFEQFKSLTHEKYTKFENNIIRLDGNNQVLGQKTHKIQERIDSLESSIESHMHLVNQEINNALNKIVGSINEKISKALENNILSVNERLKKNVEMCKGMIEEAGKTEALRKEKNTEKKIILIFNGVSIKSSGIMTKALTAEIKIKSVIESRIDHENEQIKINSDSKNEIKENNSSNEIILGYETYFIDEEGYLLDENQFYLVDENENRLQLESTKLNELQHLFEKSN